MVFSTELCFETFWKPRRTTSRLRQVGTGVFPVEVSDYEVDGIRFVPMIAIGALGTIGSGVLLIALLLDLGRHLHGPASILIGVIVLGVGPVLLLAMLLKLLVGIAALVTKSTVVFHADRVSVTTRLLWGTDKWAAPLAEFEGIRVAERWLRGPMKVVYVIELHHERPEKCIPLFEDFDSVCVLSRTKEYADWLRMPVIDGFVDADKAVVFDKFNNLSDGRF